jgi:hypothetical protein
MRQHHLHVSSELDVVCFRNFGDFGCENCHVNSLW